MGLLAFLFITAIIIELRYKPRLKTDKETKDLFLWYNLHRFTKERDFINITELFRNDF